MSGTFRDTDIVQSYSDMIGHRNKHSGTLILYDKENPCHRDFILRKESRVLYQQRVLFPGRHGFDSLGEQNPCHFQRGTILPYFPL